MHRKSQSSAKPLLVFISAFAAWFIAENPYVAVALPGAPRGCDRLTCKIGEQCVNRRFWCNYSPCPSMTYCSKSRRESLKGPESCQSVLCSPGHKCLVQVHDCAWNQRCKQRVARCVTEQRFLNGPTSCVEVACPTGHRCILRESQCRRPPCRLARSCARVRDVSIWFDKCKQIGCRSEHDCFLRKPSDKCREPPCSHVPDCLAESDVEEEENCRGWICPANQVCVAHAEAPCRNGDCLVSRSCHGPVLRPSDVYHDFKEPINIPQPQTTLSDVEREIFLEEQHKLRNFFRSTKASNYTKLIDPSVTYSDAPTRVSASKPEGPGSGKAKRVTTIPSMRSASLGDSAWLTYLKQRAGAETVQYWIDKARNNEDYEAFAKWLDSVSTLLDPETYRQWLREVVSATSDVPEFQAWISPWNLEMAEQQGQPGSQLSFGPQAAAQRSALADRLAAAGPRSFPGSIGGQSAQNVFYSDKSFVLVEPHTDSNLDYHPRAFAEKQAPASSELKTQPGVFQTPDLQQQQQQQQQQQEEQEQQQRPNPFNFNFNEARRSDEDPGFQSGIQSDADAASTLSPHFEIAARGFDQQVSNHNRPLPDEVQDFVESILNSWRTWQSNQPQANYPVVAAPFDPHHQTDLNTLPTGGTISKQQPPRPEITNSKQQPSRPEITNQNSKQNWPVQPKPSSQQKPPVTPKPVSQQRPPAQKPETTQQQQSLSQGNPDETSVLSTVLEGAKSMVDKISGLQQSNDLKSSIIQLDPDQPVSQVLVSGTLKPNVDITWPNFLIYFPPPLNILIYYTIGKNGLSTSGTRKSESPSLRGFPMELSNPDESTDNQNFTTEVEPENSEHFNKTKSINKEEKLKNIRKILKDLIESWDDQKEHIESSKKSDDKPVVKDTDMSGKINKNYFENTSQEPKNASSSNNSTDAIPSFNSFLKWLLKNNHSSLLEEKPRRRGPLIYYEPDEHMKAENLNTRESVSHDLSSRLFSEYSDDDTSKKIRVLVDIDKNPELINALLSRNKGVNKNKQKDQDVVVNLKDFVEPKEEDLIVRRLVDVAVNQLHRNFSDDQKLPKTLWVFPVYEDEENETLSDFIEKRNKEIQNKLENANSSASSPDKNNSQIQTPKRSKSVQRYVRERNYYDENYSSKFKLSNGEYDDKEQKEDNEEQNEEKRKT